MDGTLDRRRTKLGTEVWSMVFRLEQQRYEPSRVGRVQRVEIEGPVVGGRLHAWSEYPLFHSEAEARRWCEVNKPKVPGIV